MFSSILSLGMCTIQNSLSTALRDLAHNPVAFVLILIFAFCCQVSGDEKSLASKLIWKGKSWPKVAVNGKAMIFLCFLGKSSLVSWLLPRLTWSDHCFSSIIYKIFLCCIDWLSLKLMTSQVEQDACSFKGTYICMGETGASRLIRCDSTCQRSIMVTITNKENLLLLITLLWAIIFV